MLSGMSNAVIAFGEFTLDRAERRLTRSGQPLDLSGRYFDALDLLARHPGQLITKDRFMEEVWRGVPVTDEALTQCIRALRRLLGDEVARPRFIETVPRHGYRFIGPVEEPPSPAVAPPQSLAASDAPARTPHVALLLTAAGLAGGAGAGLVGGIGYGLLAATEPPPGTGAISVVLVITCLCLLVGLLGGLGVGAGIAAARRLDSGRLFPLMLGGAFGGLLVGALGRLIGLDAFTLLVGSRPAAITGGSEGMLIGALAGAAAHVALGSGRGGPERRVAIGLALGGLAGLLVALGGGQMMAGSLAVLAAAHPDAPLGTLLAARDLPLPLRILSSVAEGAIFIGALTLSFVLTCRRGPAA